jgi:tetratricopeptide (TPR) repeat protein
MITAWLTGAGPLPTDPETIHQLVYLRSQVRATHFCVANSGTTDPRNLAKNITEHLTQTIRGFSEALLKTMPEQIQIVVKQTVGTATSSNLTGVYIESLNMGVLSEEASFNRLVREPLKQLYNDGYNQPILLLIDSLDEATTYTGNSTIVDLLTKLTDFPEQVRFLVTTRPDPRILKHFPDSQSFNLIDNAPATSDDVYQYAYERLSILEERQRSRLAIAISQAAEGIFLYAYLVIEDLLSQCSEAISIEFLSLPKGLSGLYQQFLNRELGKNEDRWYDLFKPLLGAIAVSQGGGLTQKQLAGIVGKNPDDVERSLRVCAQYLQGLPDGSFRVFHKSFADFLLEDSDNTDYHIDPATVHQRIANYYWHPSQTLAEKDRHNLDGYAYHHLAYHLLEGDREDDLHALLLTDPKWMEAKFVHCDGDMSYATDLDLAINRFSDPLTVSQLLVLIQLHTARQVVQQRVNRYDDIDLRTLVWLGREAEAFNHVRLRVNAHKRFWGLFILHNLFSQRGQPRPSLLHELQKTACLIEEPRAQVSALGAVAHVLTQVKRMAEAEALFAEARQFAHQIENISQQSLALRELIVPLAHAGYFPEAEETARSIKDIKWQAWSLATLGASLAQANQLEKAKALFSESQEQALSLSNDHDQAWLLRAITGTLIEANELDTAEAVTQLIRNPQKHTEALSEFGMALVKAGLEPKAKIIFTEAETLACSIAHDFQQEDALQALAQALAQSKYYIEAERVALMIEVGWAREKALSTLSAELAQGDQFTEAERISGMMQDSSGRAFTLRVLALVHARIGDSTVATWFFQEAGAIAPTIEDHETPIFTLVLLTIILKKAGHEPQVEQVFQEALNAAQLIENDTRQESTLRAIVTELAHQHIYPEAENFAQVIQDPLNRAWALKEIAISLAQNGCKAEAGRIFMEVERLAEVVKDNHHEGLVLQHKDWVLAELSTALAQVGYFAEAERVAQTIEHSWKRTDALSELSKALAQDEQFLEAERIARAIPKNNWERVKALCAIAVALTYSENEVKATSLFVEVRRLAELIEDSTQKLSALRALATAFIQTRQFAEAETIANTVEDKENQAWILQELAIASGQPNHFSKAIKAAEKSASVWQSGMLQELAKAMFQFGQNIKAEELFAAAKNAVRNIEPSYRALALRELARSNAQLGRFSQARAIIESIDHWMERDQALRFLAKTLIQAGQIRDARQLIQTIEEAKEQRQVLGSLAIALMRQQRFTEALKELDVQTPDDFVHLLASCPLIFDQIETGLNLIILSHVVRIVGWVRPDWRKISSILSYIH